VSQVARLGKGSDQPGPVNNQEITQKVLVIHKGQDFLGTLRRERQIEKIKSPQVGLSGENVPVSLSAQDPGKL
jgi:hypothetical protein